MTPLETIIESALKLAQRLECDMDDRPHRIEVSPAIQMAVLADPSVMPYVGDNMRHPATIAGIEVHVNPNFPIGKVHGCVKVRERTGALGAVYDWKVAALLTF